MAPNVAAPSVDPNKPAAGFAASDGGAPAGVVELMKDSGFAGVVAVAVPVFVLLDPKKLPEPEGTGVPPKRPVGCVVGVPAATGGLLPNRPPDGNTLVVVVVDVAAALEGGVELVFPKRPPLGADVAVLPPPKSPPLAGACEVGPNSALPPVLAPPPGVDVPEPSPPPLNNGLCSAGFVPPKPPNKPPPAPAEGAVDVLLPPVPKEKLFELVFPAGCPNRLVVPAGFDVPNSEPAAGAVDVVALLDWPAELLAPKLKDMMYGQCCWSQQLV